LFHRGSFDGGHGKPTTVSICPMARSSFSVFARHSSLRLRTITQQVIIVAVAIRRVASIAISPFTVKVESDIR
jgi:hypothetical protein